MSQRTLYAESAPLPASPAVGHTILRSASGQSGMYVPRPFASGRCEAGEGAAAGFPGPVSHLVGRKVEAARLRAAVLRVESGRGGTVLVEGDAGIGKTALLDLVAAYCRRAGMTLLRGGGSPLEQGLPFAALLSGLRGHHQEASPQITALLRGKGRTRRNPAWRASPKPLRRPCTVGPAAAPSSCCWTTSNGQTPPASRC